MHHFLLHNAFKKKSKTIKSVQIKKKIKERYATQGKIYHAKIKRF